jgi:long-chain acyl-CoA synthetase
MDLNVSTYKAIRNAATLFPEENALLFLGKYVVYRDLIRKIDQVASGLSQMGIRQGDVITMAMPNILEAVYAFYAVSKLGAVGHMAHPTTPVKQMRRFMEKTGSKHIIVLDTFFNHYESLLDHTDIQMVLASPVDEFGWVKKIGYRLINRKKLARIPWTQGNILRFGSLYRSADMAEQPTIDSKQTAVYLHSGGTSGEPKTIELSHYAINSLAEKLPFILGVDRVEGIHILAVLPMFHGFGLCMGIHAMLMAGGTDTLMPKFDPGKTIELIKSNQVNIIIGIPSLFQSLLSHPSIAGQHLKNLRWAFVGGDIVNPDLKHRFENTMASYHSNARLLEGYGLTEVVTVCAVNLPADPSPKGVGRPLPGIEVAIIDTDSKAFLNPGEPGEIVVSGPTMMNGYLDDPDSNHQTFLIDDTGKSWVKTGDYGLIDPDGYLWFKQRLKRIVKVLGMPVLPAEIENLMTSLKEIKEAAAVGIPDPEKGFVIKLYLVEDPMSIAKPSDEIIKQMIKAEISPYAVPKEIVFLPELPKTEIGKIDTRKLETMT